MWFRVEWRSRWRSLVGLLLLIAFATASVEAAVAGARRGASAADRLLERSEPATLLVLLNRGAFDWDVVRAMPQVESLSAFAVSPKNCAPNDGPSSGDAGTPAAQRVTTLATACEIRST